MLTMAERVEVAQDVLRQMEAGYFSFRSLFFLWLKSPDGAWTARHLGEDFKTALRNDPPEQCIVCARGALFISRVFLFNEVKVTSRAERQAIDVSTIDWGDDAGVIEDWFEGFGPPESPMKTFASHERGDRLRLICENIVANEGAFLPDQLV